MEKALGPRAGAVLGVLLYIYLLLSCTAYLMIAADCLCPLLAGAFGPGLWGGARSAVVSAVGLGVALPLSLPRTLGAVAGELPPFLVSVCGQQPAWCLPHPPVR